MDHRGIDMTAFKPQPGGNEAQQKLWAACQLGQLKAGFVPVANLARQLVLYDHAAGKPILAQLALKLSEALEQQSWAQIQGKFKQLGSKVTAKFKFISMEDSFASKYRVAKTCTFYVQSTKAARSCWQHMSASTDKGDGGQLPLQQTVFAFPDNQIFVALPQASFASIGMA